jgi:hypothetical protein
MRTAAMVLAIMMTMVVMIMTMAMITRVVITPAAAAIAVTPGAAAQAVVETMIARVVEEIAPAAAPMMAVTPVVVVAVAMIMMTKYFCPKNQSRHANGSRCCQR